MLRFKILIIWKWNIQKYILVGSSKLGWSSHKNSGHGITIRLLFWNIENEWIWKCKIKSEWKEFKRMVKYFMNGVKAKDLWERILLYRRKEYRNVFMLAETVFCIGPSNSVVESGFSHLTCMLTDRRLSLSHSIWRINNQSKWFCMDRQGKRRNTRKSFGEIHVNKKEENTWVNCLGKQDTDIKMWWVQQWI